ncbi:FAD:protein FMN transferase [hydrothermal vent metagenome]|uniref:FAD:protein FMN transferase n=1 Tax=hydrothermal vent metagenome TaxID=652676 RepID=A0A3B0TQY3_9ZZZZ
MLLIMTDSLRYKACGFLWFLLGMVVLSCNDEKPSIIENRNVGGALGTSYYLIYLSEKPLDFQNEIDSVFAAVNRSLSTYIQDSDISRINKGDSRVVVDAMFREVFQLSKEVYEQTNGYFDPTVGVLVNAWGFGPGRRIEMDSTRVDSLLAFVGFEKVTITESNIIVKTHLNIHFDFNAIAKGYAIDRLAKMLDEKGIQDYLLEVGGELVAKGENRVKQKPWSVGIEDPQIDFTRQLKIKIQLKDKAMASSGNYRKYRIDSITGKKYVHTVDPKTGFTKNANTLGVTILADTCAEADAYATAFMAMNLDEVLILLSKQKSLEAYVVYLDKEGKSQEFMTDGFKGLVVE